MGEEDMTDYKKIADDLDKAVALAMSSVYETGETGPGNSEDWICDSALRVALMRISRISQWVRSLPERGQSVIKEGE